MRLQNFSLTEGAKLEIEKFASQHLSVGKRENMITDPDTKITTISWIHGYIEEIPVDLISKIYSSISLTAQYLAFCAILAIANFDVIWLNNLTLEMMRKEWQLSKSVDQAATQLIEKHFHQSFSIRFTNHRYLHMYYGLKLECLLCYYVIWIRQDYAMVEKS